MVSGQEAVLRVKLDTEDLVRELEEVLKSYDMVKRVKELEFAVAEAERQCHSLLQRVARLEDRVKDLEGWQESIERAGCEE